MNKNSIGKISLLVCSIIFGFTYSFLNRIGQYIEPFMVNAIRFMLSSLCLLPFIFKRKDSEPVFEYVKAGSIAGAMLVIGSFTQQLATKYSSPGKIGFIVSLYIIFVPILNYFIFKKRINFLTLISIVVAIFGLVILCDIKDFTLQIGDILCLICSILYAAQILYVDRCADKLDPIKFTFAEFIGTGIFSFVGVLIFEAISFNGIENVIFDFVFVSIVSGCLGYLLQVIGQKYTENTIASMIMSLESVFAIVAEFLILNQIMSIKELLGCLIMFIGVILCIKANKNNVK